MNKNSDRTKLKLSEMSDIMDSIRKKKTKPKVVIKEEIKEVETPVVISVIEKDPR